jgi:hypothetical protein
LRASPRFEPPHIHAEHGEHVAKFWLNPVGVAESHGFRAHELNRLRALVIEHRATFLEPGMPTSAVRLDATAVDVTVTEDRLIVALADGRELSAPLAWFPRLSEATQEQRGNWRLIGRGHGIHWPEVDEDISVASLLRAA